MLNGIIYINKAKSLYKMLTNMFTIKLLFLSGNSLKLYLLSRHVLHGDFFFDVYYLCSFISGI